jgi:hypothetical protein
MNGFLTEIRTFYSLKEIRESVEEELEQLANLLEDYSEWLGTLLRNPDSSRDEKWAEKTANLQKALKAGHRREKKKKEKLTSISDWVQFKDLIVCSDDFGEAEILFEAVEELRDKIDSLQGVRDSIQDLERYGLGKDIRYITYIKNGVPEKIVFRTREGTKAAEEFQFTTDFSITKQT